jgi:hypothetical protein
MQVSHSRGSNCGPFLISAPRRAHLLVPIARQARRSAAAGRERRGVVVVIVVVVVVGDDRTALAVG